MKSWYANLNSGVEFGGGAAKYPKGEGGGGWSLNEIYFGKEIAPDDG